MEAAAACASTGIGAPSWDFPGDGLFDRSIKPTHDHDMTKSNLPDWVRLPRKLTKIENGCSKGSPLGQLKRIDIPQFDEKTSTYQIKMAPKLKIRGSLIDAQALTERVSLLNQSLTGREFIRYLEGLGDKVELSLLKREGRVQVVVDATSRGHVKLLDPKRAPCEWIGKVDRDDCDRFLKAIELGTTCIQIEKDHPQKEAILQIFKEVSMRSIGIHFLLRFKELNKRVTIGYKQGENLCGLRYQDGIAMRIDLQVAGWSFGGLSKKSSEIISVPIDPKYFLIHELIHAQHGLLQKFHGAPDMTQYLSQVVEYDPEKKAYACPHLRGVLKGHGNLEEEITICGQEWYTENAFRYMFFDPLRWGHKAYELLIQDNPGPLTEFWIDPCGPEGVYNRVALMILRNELIYSETILSDASDQEIEEGIQQVSRLLLSEGQKSALNLVYDLFTSKARSK